jgi:hypothetical protein
MHKKKVGNHMEDYLCVGFFYCVTDYTKIDLENTQIMHCIFCYQKLVIGIYLRTQTRKGLISYYKTNGITSLKKDVDAKHTVIAKMFEEKIFFC